jgi:hypothetical protein
VSRPFTLVRFRILPPLYELHEETVAVPLEFGTALLHLQIVDSYVPSSFEGGGKGTSAVPGDAVGVAHNSMIEVALPGLVSMQPARQLGPGDVPEGQLRALRVLNHVIQHYRVLANVPQIRPVTATDGRGFKFTHFRRDGTTKSGIVLGRNALPPNGETADMPKPNKEIAEAIKRASGAGPSPLWATLKADAFADMDAGDVRSGFAHLHMSLEVLAHQTVRHLSKADRGIGEGAEFGHLRSDAEPPNLPAVVRECFDLYAGGYSRTRIEELTEGLLKHKNDVLHGRDVRLASGAVDEALACYLELKDWLVAALFLEVEQGVGKTTPEAG